MDIPRSRKKAPSGPILLQAMRRRRNVDVGRARYSAMGIMSWAVSSQCSKDRLQRVFCIRREPSTVAIFSVSRLRLIPRILPAFRLRNPSDLCTPSAIRAKLYWVRLQWDTLSRRRVLLTRRNSRTIRTSSSLRGVPED